MSPDVASWRRNAVDFKGRFLKNKAVIQKSKTEVPSPEQFPDRDINQKNSAVNTDGGILPRKTSFSSNLLDYSTTSKDFGQVYMILNDCV